MPSIPGVVKKYKSILKDWDANYNVLPFFSLKELPILILKIWMDKKKKSKTVKKII